MAHTSPERISLFLVVSHLGSDWAFPSLVTGDRPLLSNPTPENTKMLPPPHSWQPIDGLSPSLQAGHI